MTKPNLISALSWAFKNNDMLHANKLLAAYAEQHALEFWQVSEIAEKAWKIYQNGENND